jgi:hypothetical protein
VSLSYQKGRCCGVSCAGRRGAKWLGEKRGLYESSSRLSSARARDRMMEAEVVPDSERSEGRAGPAKVVRYDRCRIAHQSVNSR